MFIRSASLSSAFPLSPERAFCNYLARRLNRFDTGNLTLTFPNGKSFQHRGAIPGPNAVVAVRRWRLLYKLLAEGEIGLARGFVDGDWSTPDLSGVLDFGLCNEAAISTATQGLTVAHFINRWMHVRNSNTPRGSRRNISAHYDLGNEFYARWLDPEMIYSSAIFENDSESLETAQERKLKRIVDLLEIAGGESVLETGCGWGGLARHLVGSGAGSVKGISLSKEQIDYARARTRGSNAAQKISFELMDYRSLRERHDRIISIEMIEAVGERYWPIYFEKLRQSLNDGGVVVLQVITIAEQLFESYRSRPDFIQQYIFPGGMLPTVDIIREQAERAGFQLVHHEPFGPSYAQTLDIWHERFNANWADISELGFDDRFRRIWNYYLKYCAAGFRHGAIDVGLFKLKPV